MQRLPPSGRRQLQSGSSGGGRPRQPATRPSPPATASGLATATCVYLQKHTPPRPAPLVALLVAALTMLRALIFVAVAMMTVQAGFDTKCAYSAEW